MRIHRFILLPLGMLLTIPSATHAQANGTFTEPNSALLFGRYGSNLYVVTPDKTIELKDVTEDGAPAYFRVPSLARTLDRIAWSVEGANHAVIGIYTLRDKSWKGFADVCFGGGGSAVFSPEATKVAFVLKMPSSPIDEVCPTTDQTVLQILDLVTGKTKMLSCCGWVLSARPSWSPDGT